VIRREDETESERESDYQNAHERDERQEVEKTTCYENEAGGTGNIAYGKNINDQLLTSEFHDGLLAL